MGHLPPILSSISFAVGPGTSQAGQPLSTQRPSKKRRRGPSPLLKDTEEVPFPIRTRQAGDSARLGLVYHPCVLDSRFTTISRETYGKGLKYLQLGQPACPLPPAPTLKKCEAKLDAGPSLEPIPGLMMRVRLPGGFANLAELSRHICQLERRFTKGGETYRGLASSPTSPTNDQWSLELNWDMGM